MEAAGAFREGRRALATQGNPACLQDRSKDRQRCCPVPRVPRGFRFSEGAEPNPHRCGIRGQGTSRGVRYWTRWATMRCCASSQPPSSGASATSTPSTENLRTMVSQSERPTARPGASYAPRRPGSADARPFGSSPRRKAAGARCSSASLPFWQGCRAVGARVRCPTDARRARLARRWRGDREKQGRHRGRAAAAPRDLGARLLGAAALHGHLAQVVPPADGPQPPRPPQRPSARPGSRVPRRARRRRCRFG